MTALRTAAQQALDYWERVGWGDAVMVDKMDALRAALAQQTLNAPEECEHKADGWYAVQRVAGVTRVWPMTEAQALRAALAQQAEPVEPVAWKQGNLVTFNEDSYPVLGGLFVQFWDGEEVAARVYANDLKTLRQRCAKVNTAPPQRNPEPVEPVATLGYARKIEELIAQRDALLEACKLARSIIGHPDDAHSQIVDATIKAVEGEKP